MKEFTDPYTALGGEVISVTPYNAKQSSYAVRSDGGDGGRAATRFT